MTRLDGEHAFGDDFQNKGIALEYQEAYLFLDWVLNVFRRARIGAAVLQLGDSASYRRHCTTRASHRAG